MEVDQAIDLALLVVGGRDDEADPQARGAQQRGGAGEPRDDAGGPAVEDDGRGERAPAAWASEWLIEGGLSG